MLFLRVFSHFLEFEAQESAEIAYLDSTNHYLQLLYWSSVPKKYGFRAKVRQSLFLGPKRAQACLGWHPAKKFLRFLRYLAQSQFRSIRKTIVRALLAEKLIFHIFWAILGYFWPFLRVFIHFHGWFCLNLAENWYIDSTSYYLKLLY